MTRSNPLSRFSLATPAALLLAACAIPGAGGADDANARKPAAPFDCALQATRSGNMVDIAGSLVAREALAGSYRLSLGQSGGGNSAMIDQGGDFIVAAGEAISLGQISLSAPAGLTGELAIDWAGGTVTCPMTGL